MCIIICARATLLFVVHDDPTDFFEEGAPERRTKVLQPILFLILYKPISNLMTHNISFTSKNYFSINYMCTLKKIETTTLCNLENFGKA